MLKQSKNNRSGGFTIIEVMIVLAIVGLIMLIVFLAVPSLQRNSRNTQRKNDASSIASAIGTFASNNNGDLPALLGKNTDTSLLDLCSKGNGGAFVSGSTVCTAGKPFESAKIGYYDISGGQVRMTAVNTTAGFSQPTVSPASTAISDSTITVDQVLIVPKASCSVTASKYAYSPRSAVVLYVTEAASGNGSLQCIEQ